MPVIRSSDAVVHEMHGTRFHSYAAPSRGSAELCAWQVDIPADSAGLTHQITRDEVFLVLSGQLRMTINDESADLRVGDVAIAPGGSEICLDGGPCGGSAWVTTTPGIVAVTADGTRIVPPWMQ
jgi:glyoxylate utilization-related uncharacterized protein